MFGEHALNAFRRQYSGERQTRLCQKHIGDALETAADRIIRIGYAAHGKPSLASIGESIQGGRTKNKPRKADSAIATLAWPEIKRNPATRQSRYAPSTSEMPDSAIAGRGLASVLCVESNNGIFFTCPARGQGSSQTVPFAGQFTVPARRALVN